MHLRLAGIIPETIVDGPGVRFAVFVQGCSRRCKGCHNPGAQDPHGGVEVTVQEVIDRIKEARNVDGVTFSGGEPFEQATPLAALGKEVRRLGLTLVIFSGYRFEELQEKGHSNKAVHDLLAAGTLLVDGAFIEQERDLNLPFRGSRNQRIIDLPRSLQAGVAVEWQGPFESR